VRRAHGRDLSGILLLDKPAGISSNAALQRARRLFDARKAGHTGNLDVLASGLLPVCFGEATKISAFLLDSDKEYEAEITFGVTTTTDDAEGDVLSRTEGPPPCEHEVRALLTEFVGDIDQVPPMYSALKHRGQRLYRLAQQGIAIERKSRRVHIAALDLVSVRGTTICVRVACSKGTYVRTLAADIGARAGTGAYLSGLRRTVAGPFKIADAVSLDQLEAFAAGGLAVLDSRLRSIDSALLDQPELALVGTNSVQLRQGQTIRVAQVPRCGLVRLYDEDRAFLGIGQVLEDGRVAPRRLLQASAC
jgi:tRNA pseudouridine55 synthase